MDLGRHLPVSPAKCQILLVCRLEFNVPENLEVVLQER